MDRDHTVVTVGGSGQLCGASSEETLNLTAFHVSTIPDSFK